MKAVVKSVRISPKKLNLIADMVRNKGADEAMEILELLPKKGAKIMHKALKSAMANAANNFKQEAASLMIKEIIVSKAPTYKRWIPASRGRAQPILKRNSRLAITVGVKEPDKGKKAPAKKAAAAPKSKTAAKPAAKPAAKAEPKKPAKTTKA